MKIFESPHNWTFHPRKSHQIESRETLKTQILKNILSIFHNWGIDPLMSCEKSLCGLASGPTCDWVTKTRQHSFFLKFLTFLQKQKTFQRQLKHLKIFLNFINKDRACENTFNQVQSHKWIWHSFNIDMCDVCGYQQWDSPSSNVKFQWSIQPNHTQLALDKVTRLNYRNTHIWPPTKLDYITW